MPAPSFRGTTAIIAGCGRSGSTSLFQMLAASPQIAHSTIKEPRFFLDCHYAVPTMMAAYENCFDNRPNALLRLEATSAYFYAVPDVPALIHNSLAEARIILIFREPYARLISEFRYLKTRFLIPADLTLAEYVDDCMELPDAEWRRWSNRHILGVRNGYYDRFFPDWVMRFGDRLKVIFYDDLASDPEQVVLSLTTWLGLAPIIPRGPVTIENKGTSFRTATVQRSALVVNDRFEPFFRQHPALKAILRSVYYRLNGSRPERVLSLSQDHPLRRAYEDSRRIFRAQLLQWNPALALPSWLQLS
jgi:hypothetical protein